ncbi:hypothetical protein [Chitinophaga sp. XS-30]|uniref:hypothetical protein n=1 Tax=Chitinophaga sp. XS-30 TaxID=2604421 RepID=UPI0011DC8077|nr:hypothetical protein [Chitinophaga sp. XS-30]QEH42704.1 hypothetical protein FW415_18205 [Chitinophaga sp. XS-30]
MKAISRLAIITTIIFGVLTGSCNYGTGVGEKRRTPSDFLNNVPVRPSMYSADKTVISRQLQDFLNEHKYSFYSKEYFDSTVLKIDTILYNKEYNKVSIFVVTKNPVHRQLVPNQKHSWYYDSYCYIGIRQKDTFNLKWMRPFSVSNFYNEKEAVNYLMQQYFNEFSTLRNADGKYAHDFNLDDKRFWESSTWGKYFKSTD